MNNQTLGIIAFIGGLAVVLGVGYLFKGKIRRFLDYFIERVDEWGPWGYVAYGALYTLLEVLALPAIPLTMTSGVLFGIVPGTIVVSGASTAAATIAFLIARYAARDKASDHGYLQAKHSQICSLLIWSAFVQGSQSIYWGLCNSLSSLLNICFLCILNHAMHAHDPMAAKHLQQCKQSPALIVLCIML